MHIITNTNKLFLVTCVDNIHRLCQYVKKERAEKEERRAGDIGKLPSEEACLGQIKMNSYYNKFFY